MSRHFAAAPWPKKLKFMSAAATLLLVAVGCAAYVALPRQAGLTPLFNLAIALTFPGILVVSLSFVVRGYALDGNDLVIQRLFWRTRIPLVGLPSVSVAPGICKGSIRLMGNGGLFAFTGLYRNKALGRYRLFATDLSRPVVILLQGRTVVVTPAAPDHFAEQLRRLFPQAG